MLGRALIARRRRVVAGVTFQRRYAPVVGAAKRACEERGAIHSAVATFYKNTLGDGPYYRGAIDILTCDAIHAVDTQLAPRPFLVVVDRDQIEDHFGSRRIETAT